MGQYLLELFGNYYYFWGYVGFAAGTCLFLYNAAANGLMFMPGVIAITLSIYGGLLGARILFLLEYNPSLLLTGWPRVLDFWSGGLSWIGGPGVGVVAGGVALRLMRVPVMENLGAAAPGIALAHAISRISCVVNGCCYGRPTAVPWAVYSEVLQTHVHPTQVYSMLCELGAMAFLQVLFIRRAYRKYLFPLYGVILGSQRFITEGFRGSPPGPEIISGLRFYQSVSFLLVATSLCAAMILYDRKKGFLVSGLVGTLVAATLILFHPIIPAAAAFPRGMDGKVGYLVATRGLFAEAMASWIRLREQQGFRVTLRSWDDPPTSQEVSDWVRSIGQQCQYLLLVGDCGSSSAELEAWHMPSSLSSEGSPADSSYGDIDGDRVPEIAVGRLPVHDLQQLRSQIGKIRDYELHGLQQRQTSILTRN